MRGHRDFVPAPPLLPPPPVAADALPRIAGATATVAFYVVFNVAMVLGLLPVVGMPLPLISYGGTAMLTAMSCFGLILSAYLHRDDKLNTTGLF